MGPKSPRRHWQPTRKPNAMHQDRLSQESCPRGSHPDATGNAPGPERGQERPGSRQSGRPGWPGGSPRACRPACPARLRNMSPGYSPTNSCGSRFSTSGLSCKRQTETRGGEPGAWPRTPFHRDHAGHSGEEDDEGSGRHLRDSQGSGASGAPAPPLPPPEQQGTPGAAPASPPRPPAGTHTHQGCRAGAPATVRHLHTWTRPIPSSDQPPQSTAALTRHRGSKRWLLSTTKRQH